MNTLRHQPFIRMIAIALLGIVVVFFSVKYAVEQKLAGIESVAKAHVNEQFVLLSDLVKFAAGNNADEATNAIIKDCSGSERDRFFMLLNGLNDGLSSAQLTELDALFGRCADYHSVRKSFMATRLEREVAVYKDRIDMLSAIKTTVSEDEYMLDAWDELIDSEQEQSELYAKLVKLQGEIIIALIAGRARDSEQITEILKEVSSVQQGLNVARTRSLDTQKRLLPT